MHGILLLVEEYNYLLVQTQFIPSPPSMNTSLEIQAAEPLSHWAFLAGLVLIVYDHFLTLSAETRLIWQHNGLPWLLLIRYLALTANIVMTVFSFGNFGPQRRMDICQLLRLMRRFFLLVQEAVAYVILSLRVYVLFNGNRGTLALLILAGLGSLGTVVWLGTTADALSPPHESSCILSHVSEIYIAGVWEVGLFRDVLIFALTLWRGIWLRRCASSHSPLVNCFVLDGFVYFCSMTLVDLANILMYYFFAGNLAWLASALSTVLIGRLILNLREVVDVGIYGAETLRSSE
ncbi:hypothetical protein B0H14DRAFT_3855763 [Mycena olivaceomarginata]|nr:hypothetical protein B0H14DRAFT_3855763 [Mycena olivaceomarginata]